MPKSIEEASTDKGLEGAVVTTTDFFLEGAYYVVPGKRKYRKEYSEAKSPLTNQKGSGSCWIKRFS